MANKAEFYHSRAYLLIRKKVIIAAAQQAKKTGYSLIFT